MEFFKLAGALYDPLNPPNGDITDSESLDDDVYKDEEFDDC
jgi:hypothetical protein